MSYLEDENNPEVSRLKAKIEAFVDVVQNLNIMSVQRGFSIFEQALNESPVQFSEFGSEVKQEELNERTLIHSLIDTLKDQSHGIYMTFDQNTDPATGEVQNVVRVELAEELRNDDTPEIMKIVSPKDKDSNPEVTSTFLQEGPEALNEFETVIQDLIPDFHDSMSDMIDNKIKAICTAIGIFPSDKLEWHFEEDRLPAIIMEKPLLNSLLRYGLNSIHEDAYSKLEDLLEKIAAGEEGFMFFDPNVAWIRQGNGYSEIVSFGVIGRTGHPDHGLTQLPFRKDLEEERRRWGNILFSHSSMILKNLDYDDPDDDKNFYDDITDEYFDDYDVYVRGADNKLGKFRALDPDDEDDYRLIRAAMSHASYTHYFQPKKNFVEVPETGEFIVEEEVTKLQKMYEPVRYSHAVVDYTNIMNPDSSIEQSLNMESYHQPKGFRGSSLIKYEYEAPLFGAGMKNNNPEYGDLDTLSNVQALNLIRVLLAAPDIATRKRSIDGLI